MIISSGQVIQPGDKGKIKTFLSGSLHPKDDTKPVVVLLEQDRLLKLYGPSLSNIPQFYTHSTNEGTMELLKQAGVTLSKGN
ncbi:hypothetical protein, partial [Acidovorax sp.]|uniref:hypothetical protein n=1 Tax=Acidovorax sp. TaxID=1872122 RepID=UPI00391F5078